MAVSGVNNFTVSRDTIIKAVLRTLNVIGLGEVPEAEDYTNCTEALNLMVKAWSNKGLPLHMTDEIEFKLNPKTKQYPLGPLGGSIDYLEILEGGVGLVDGLYPFTIPSTDGLDGSGEVLVQGGTIYSYNVLESGNGLDRTDLVLFPNTLVRVFVKGLKVSKPLNVFGAHLQSGTYSRPLSIISRQEYKDLSNTGVASFTNQVYYDEQREMGFINVYNTASQLEDVLKLQIQREVFDVVEPEDEVDFPKEWFNALKWGLVNELSLEYNANAELIQLYEARAAQSLMESFEASVEEAEVFFTLKGYR